MPVAPASTMPGTQCRARAICRRSRPSRQHRCPGRRLRVGSPDDSRRPGASAIGTAEAAAITLGQSPEPAASSAVAARWLSGVNTYSGGTTLAAGALRLADNHAFGTALTTTGWVVRLRHHHCQSDRGQQQDHPVQVITGTAPQAGVISETQRPAADREGLRGHLRAHGQQHVYRRHHDQCRRTRPRRLRHQQVHRGQWSTARSPSTGSDTLSFGGLISGTGAFMRSALVPPCSPPTTAIAAPPRSAPAGRW